MKNNDLKFIPVQKYSYYQEFTHLEVFYKQSQDAIRIADYNSVTEQILMSRLNTRQILHLNIK